MSTRTSSYTNIRQKLYGKRADKTKWGLWVWICDLTITWYVKCKCHSSGIDLLRHLRTGNKMNIDVKRHFILYVYIVWKCIFLTLLFWVITSHMDPLLLAKTAVVIWQDTFLFFTFFFQSSSRSLEMPGAQFRKGFVCASITIRYKPDNHHWWQMICNC